MIAASFVFFLLLMTLVGVAAAKKAKGTSEDYLLAGRDVNPFAIALSAVSSCHSGYMFIGFIGFTYWYGISALWFVLTWVLGDLIVWLKIYKPLREKSQELDTKTITAFAGTSKEKRHELVIRFAALISFVFLAVYAAAQLKAGAKALDAMLSLDQSLGIIIGAAIVLIYCFSGGIRASIWTDVVQSIIMFISMFLLVFLAISKAGGFIGVLDTIRAINPALLDWRPAYLQYPLWLFLIALMANGIAVIGQPHVVVRAMAIDSKDNLDFARNIYISWYLVFSLLAVGVGLSARVLLPSLSNIDSEFTLPVLSMELLPQELGGMVLAGIFSSVVSTADSQVLSCSANLTQDLFPKWKNNYLVSKLATLVSILLVLSIALFSQESVFNLVVFAWSVLGTSLGSLIILRCLNKPIGEQTSILMMLAASTAVIYWKYFTSFSESIHEALPGFIAAFGIYYLSRLIKPQYSQDTV